MSLTKVAIGLSSFSRGIAEVGEGLSKFLGAQQKKLNIGRELRSLGKEKSKIYNELKSSLSNKTKRMKAFTEIKGNLRKKRTLLSEMAQATKETGKYRPYLDKAENTLKQEFGLKPGGKPTKIPMLINFK